MKSNSLRATLVVGAIGIVLGAATVQTAHQILDASFRYTERPSRETLTKEGEQNRDSRGLDTNAVYPSSARP